MSKRILLNSDLGEGFGAWRMGEDSLIMPYIDCANIACGFHAGDPLIMQNTVSAAVEHGVQIGAHPAYPDLVGFGRRSMALQPAEVEALVMYQIGALAAFCNAAGTTVAYVKPHGALYHDMLKNDAVFAAVVRAVKQASSGVSKPLPLVMLAKVDASHWQQIASEYGVELWFEGFADRAYNNDGTLVARTQPGAVIHEPEAMLEQALQFAEQSEITTINGQRLALHIDTLCVHGDTHEALAAVQAIRSHAAFAK